jgi:hypothetical protein
VPLIDPPDEAARARLLVELRSAGYRTVERGGRRRPWSLHGTRRGWSRFAGQLSHLALVLIGVGVAVGVAFGSETTFSLLPGEQAFLDTPRPDFSDAVRLEGFEADFDDAGRPMRLDADVTFMRGGEPIERRVLQVNDPGSFGGYLVHAWTYGPAAELRITTVAGRPLHDGPVPLNDDNEGRPFGLLDLPSLGTTVGVTLLDAERNEISLAAVAAAGLVDIALLAPGEEARLGPLMVTLSRFSVWVTFASRSDPGLGLLFGGAAILVVALGVGFWLPRRRVSISWRDDALRIILRGERFDRPTAELERLVALARRASGAG